MTRATAAVTAWTRIVTPVHTHDSPLVLADDAALTGGRHTVEPTAPSMKRTSEHHPPVANPGGSHPDAGAPLSAFRRVVVSCNDCGDVTILEDAQLAELSAVPTFGDLWRLAFCRVCRAAGSAGGANVELRGERTRPVAPAPEPEWSAKPVFADDRSDPFPTLPRRRMFGG